MWRAPNANLECLKAMLTHCEPSKQPPMKRFSRHVSSPCALVVNCAAYTSTHWSYTIPHSIDSIYSIISPPQLVAAAVFARYSAVTSTVTSITLTST
jgi:hypothetical protein